MVKAFVTEGDAGSGRPGTPQWHRVQIAQMDDDQIIEYIKEAFDLTASQIAEEIIDGHTASITRRR